MQFVPFAFCESVYNLFHEDFLNNVQINSRTWKAAARESLENRMNLWVEFSCVAGVWKYVLDVETDGNLPTNITFDELKQLNQRLLHVIGVHLGEHTSLDSSYPHSSSLEEIYEIVNFTFHFLFQPSIEIMRASDFPEKTLSAILLRYQNVSFSNINIVDQQKLAENFLTTQLQRDKVVRFLQVFDGAEKFSDNLRAVLEEFAISRHFNELGSTMVFHKPFFEIFFEKTTFLGKCELSGDFSFDLAAFKPELQDFSLSVAGKSIAWIRDDEVLVKAIHVCDRNWFIHLISNEFTERFAH